MFKISVKENRIIYDWVTFTSKIDSVDSIIDTLGLFDVRFISLDHGMNGYPYCLYFDGISICYGGREDMGICVSMSGQGCRTFETFSSVDFDYLFDLIISHYSDDAEKREMNLSRLDVAFDDFSGTLDINKILTATIANGYNTETGRLNRGNFVTRFNSYDVHLGSKGISCDFGSLKSDIYIRIYDKRAEQKRLDLPHWVRCEIQLRGTNAIGFCMLAGDICHNYFGVLNNYLRFVDPDPNDSNIRRAPTSKFWADFLQFADSLSIFQNPGTDYDIMCLDGFVYGQCAGAISTMIELVGFEKFLERIEEVRRSKPLNRKYRDLLNKMQAFREKLDEES